MTVSYGEFVLTSDRSCVFLRLLWWRRGSIYSLVWIDLLCYVALYFALSLLYRCGLNDEGTTGCLILLLESKRLLLKVREKQYVNI